MSDNPYEAQYQRELAIEREAQRQGSGTTLPPPPSQLGTTPTKMEEYRRALGQVTPQQVGRFALELGGSLASLHPAVRVPAQVLRLMPNLAPVALRSTVSGLGAGTGSLASETFNPTEHPLETAKEAAKFASVGQGVGEMGGALLSKIAAPGAGSLQPGAMATQRLLGKKGESLTVGQATTNRLFDTLENISEAGFIGSTTGKVKEGSALAAQELVDDIVRAYGKRGTSRELGEEMQKGLVRGAEDWKRVGSDKYKQLDAALATLPGVIQVDLTPAKLEARKLLREQAIIKDKASVGLLQMILNAPKAVPFSEANRIRSRLLRIHVGDESIIKGEVESYASLLSQRVDDAMEVAAKAINPQTSPDIYKLWREASAYWKGGQPGQLGASTLEDPVLRKLMTDDPGTVVDVLLRSGKRDAFTVAKNLLPPEVVEGIKRDYLERLVSSATKDIQGSVERQVSGNVLAQKAGLNTSYSNEREILRQLFSPKEAQELEEVVNLLRLTQVKSENQGFTFAVKGAQIGGMMSLLLEYSVRGALTASAAPNVFGFLLNNPVSRWWIIHGSRLPAGTPQATAAIMKVAAIAERNGIPVVTNLPGSPSQEQLGIVGGEGPSRLPPHHLQLPQVPEFRQAL